MNTTRRGFMGLLAAIVAAPKVLTSATEATPGAQVCDRSGEVSSNGITYYGLEQSYQHYCRKNGHHPDIGYCSRGTYNEIVRQFTYYQRIVGPNDVGVYGLRFNKAVITYDPVGLVPPGQVRWGRTVYRDPRGGAQIEF